MAKGVTQVKQVVTVISKSGVNKQITKAPKTNAKKQTAKVKASGTETKANVPYVEADFLGDGKWGKDQIKLSSWNVNGLRAILKRGDLQKYIDSSKPDAIFIGETRIDKTVFNDIYSNQNIPKEYHSFWDFCKIKKGYSGVAMLTKSKPISVSKGMGIEKHDQEGRVITTEFENFYHVGAYVISAGDIWKDNRLDYYCEWTLDFVKYLNKLKEKKNVIVTGDLNSWFNFIDKSFKSVKMDDFSIRKRKWLVDLFENGWVDTYRDLNPEKKEYSMWKNNLPGARKDNIGWRLDYFIATKELMQGIQDSKIMTKVMGSDHCPIELTMDLSKLTK